MYNKIKKLPTHLECNVKYMKFFGHRSVLKTDFNNNELHYY